VLGILATVVVLSACQPRPDLELERARANFEDFTKGIFTPNDCKRLAFEVRRRPDKSIEASATWRVMTGTSADNVGPNMVSVFRADPDVGWKCDASQSSSAGACELLQTCKLMREAHAGGLGDIRIEVPPPPAPLK
jgi:hypothetical protein